MSTTPDVVIDEAPQLRVGIAAAPSSGVIPGAVVGVAIDVFNDGNAAGARIETAAVDSDRNGISHRHAAHRRPRTASARTAFWARLADAASPRRHLIESPTFQLRDLPGVNMLYLQPRLQADGVPVVGTAGMSIKRRHRRRRRSARAGETVLRTRGRRGRGSGRAKRRADHAARAARTGTRAPCRRARTRNQLRPRPKRNQLRPRRRKQRRPKPVVAAAPFPLLLPSDADPELILEPAPKKAAPKKMRKSTPTPEPESESAAAAGS